jgi:hypothetical protein
MVKMVIDEFLPIFKMANTHQTLRIKQIFGGKDCGEREGEIRNEGP